MANVTIVTPEKRLEFLEALERTGSVSRAANHCRVHRRSFYRHRLESPDFAKAWDESAKIGREVLADQLEREADKRAIEGWDEPRFYEGNHCGDVRKFSDTLLILRLKALRPDKYRENIQHQHDPDKPLKIQVEYVSQSKSDDQD
ncbi:MAG: terminase [Blastocatellia bacterium]